MHHFIYPSKDTYITNRSTLDSKNFGVDEILQIGTSNTIVRTLSPTKEYVYTNTVFNRQPMTDFTGTFTGSFVGTIDFVSGDISGTDLLFSASYFNGTVDGVPFTTSGSISGSLVIGALSGSLIATSSIGEFVGQMTGSNVCLTGTGSGVNVQNQPNWISTDSKFVDRTLIAFNLTEISNSIVSGDITNPSFFLKLKVCNEYDLPISYTVYALPISQSWNMGNGYLSDGGSDTGVSWRYRDNNSGTPWYSASITTPRPAIDFINTPSEVTESFSYGGGTWHVSNYCSQSFNYQSSDIYMNVTSIVTSWLNGGISNQGFLLIHSDELQSTGSGFILKYFSRDTNTIYSPCLDVAWDDSVFSTGSVSTGSVSISTMNAGITASVHDSVLTIDGGVSGSFTGSTALVITAFDSNYNYYDGFVSGKGIDGNILGLSVYGESEGYISTSPSLITGPCGQTFSASLATGSFYSGPFSSSTFTAYYVNHKFENAFLTGSWIPAAISGTIVTIPIPSDIPPYYRAYLVGDYVSGTAIGTYQLSGSTSASFDGNLINGLLLGGRVSLQLTGSMITSSYVYTGSVEMTSSIISMLDIAHPFSINIQNLQPEYKAGDIIKLDVFGRKKFPLKQFGRSTQQEQYMIPEALPSTSYYALKDNVTNETVVDFDAFTKISCEYPYGNYFLVDTTGLPQERYYRVIIRVESDQSIYTLDTGKTFKITR